VIRRVLQVASLALTAALVLAWIVFLRPVSLGGPADYVIVSGHSMEPTFRTGDVVVALRQSSYRRGDVVVYRVPADEPAAGDRVIHRIVGGSAATGFVMKGDNKDGVDPWRPTPKDVIGRELLRIPDAGQGLLFLRTPLGVALIAGMTTLLIALAGGASGKRRGQPAKSASSIPSPGSRPSASA
jgi:signal peptidase I